MNKSVIKNADMSSPMQRHALAIVTDSVRKFELEKDIADHLKKEFDTKYGPTWHCIVGKNFGSSVTHEPNSFIYFFVEKYAILLYKSG
ncbi:unnamed protein product [Heterobilharzia americana]|nr:unnamed protein product [Heterobilharzia americana]CAH8469488.1 unnamed protein product [Heterobilharzia americana]